MAFSPHVPEPHKGAAPSGDARCPRCGRTFTCGRYKPVPCACAQVRLSDAQRAALRARFEDCLCLDCLREVARNAV